MVSYVLLCYDMLCGAMVWYVLMWRAVLFGYQFRIPRGSPLGRKIGSRHSAGDKESHLQAQVGQGPYRIGGMNLHDLGLTTDAHWRYSTTQRLNSIKFMFCCMCFQDYVLFVLIATRFKGHPFTNCCNYVQEGPFILQTKSKLWVKTLYWLEASRFFKVRTWLAPKYQQPVRQGTGISASRRVSRHGQLTLWEVIFLMFTLDTFFRCLKQIQVFCFLCLFIQNYSILYKILLYKILQISTDYSFSVVSGNHQDCPTQVCKFKQVHFRVLWYI